MARLHPASRIALLVGGGVLIVASPVVGLLPGPGGVFVFAAGLVMVLRASHRARVAWARLKRRWPKAGTLVDRAMRRRSVRRRMARDAAERSN